jgi:SAM-dependent methyltransferase
MAAAGHNPHGEADRVAGYRPATVLDAGCGTGRVAIELARRGIEVVGVDLDPDLLDQARAKAPELEWVLADLADLDLGRTFDVVVLAGNVVGFVEPARRPAAVAAAARHVAPGGRLVSGCQLRLGWPTVDDHDGWCRAAGLELEERTATWEGAPLGVDPDYAVSVHRRPPVG